MSDTSSSSSGGIGFCGALTILLIGLKLTGYLGWSWWWVWSPMWGPFVFFFCVAAVICLIEVGSEVVKKRAARRPVSK